MVASHIPDAVLFKQETTNSCYFPLLYMLFYSLFTPFCSLPSRRTFYKLSLSILPLAFSISVKSQNTDYIFAKNFSCMSHSKHLIHTAKQCGSDDSCVHLLNISHCNTLKIVTIPLPYPLSHSLSLPYNLNS